MEHTTEEAGFTLIELLVVMIIVAILLAIAIPTFLTQKSTAHRTRAIQNVKQVVNAAESCAIANGGDYQRCLDHQTLLEYEPTIEQLINWGCGSCDVKGDIDGITNGSVVKDPVEPTSAYVVSMDIQDGDKRIWFSEAHLDSGRIIRGCGLGSTGNAAPSGGAPAEGAPVPGSRACTTGRWG